MKLSYIILNLFTLFLYKSLNYYISSNIIKYILSLGIFAAIQRNKENKNLKKPQIRIFYHKNYILQLYITIFTTIAIVHALNQDDIELT